MNNAQLKKFLRDRNVLYLYHANTVVTSCTFFENGGLLSRGVVEDRGLFQTPQETDERDKQVDVFYDLFFDSIDIHRRKRNLNHYGPVMFVYSIDLIDSLPEDSIRITKDNPIRWHSGMTEEEKYFLSEDELKIGFAKGDFTQHFTIRHQMEPLSFKYLRKIVLDDPGVEDTRYFENAHQHLQKLIEQYAPTISLEVRQCPPECGCQEQYRSHRIGYVYHRFKTNFNSLKE